MVSVAGIYLALFGRPADPLGLMYFNHATKFGRDFSAVSELSSQKEYQARFAGATTEIVVDSIYLSLFNRHADADGLLHFSNALKTGQQNINTIALSIYGGALGQDKSVRDIKTQASILFTESIDTVPEIAGYQGLAAAESGVRFLASVTDRVPSEDEIDRAVLDGCYGPLAASVPSPAEFSFIL